LLAGKELHDFSFNFLVKKPEGVPMTIFTLRVSPNTLFVSFSELFRKNEQLSKKRGICLKNGFYFANQEMFFFAKY